MVNKFVKKSYLFFGLLAGCFSYAADDSRWYTPVVQAANSAVAHGVDFCKRYPAAWIVPASIVYGSGIGGLSGGKIGAAIGGVTLGLVGASTAHTVSSKDGGVGWASSSFAASCVAGAVSAVVTPDNKNCAVVLPVATLLVGSWVNGIYRTRAAEKQLRSIEQRYSISVERAAWYQLHKHVDNGAKALLTVSLKESSPIDEDEKNFFQGVAGMIAVPGAVDKDKLWGSTKEFVTSVLGATEFGPAGRAAEPRQIAKTKFVPLGYATVETLQDGLPARQAAIERDLKALCSISTISWSEITGATTLEAYQALKNRINDVPHFCGTYMIFGSLGYGALHNHVRVKKALCKLIELRRVIVQLNSLFTAVTTPGQTDIDRSGGYLEFTI